MTCRESAGSIGEAEHDALLRQRNADRDVRVQGRIRAHELRSEHGGCGHSLFAASA